MPSIEMTQAEFARHRGVSRQMVGKWVGQKKIVLLEKPDGSKVIDAAAADLALDGSIERVTERLAMRQAVAAPAPADDAADADDDDDSSDPAARAGVSRGGAGLTRAKTATEVFRARLAQLEYEKRIGSVCDSAEVEAQTFALFRRLRDRLLSLPALVAPRLAAAPDERALRTIVDDEMRKILDQFAGEVEGAALPGAGDDDAGTFELADADA